MEGWQRPIAAPNLQSLCTYLQQPLTDQEKIPISQGKFNRLCVPLSQETRDNTSSAQELSTLFRVSKDECARSICDLFWIAIVTVPPSNGTENLFHTIWDRNIYSIIYFILSGSTRIRNSSDRITSTSPKRPDSGLLVNEACIFRGEEEGSYSNDDPERELLDKLVWTYGAVDYILGLLWILSRFEKFLCIHDRISRTNYERPLCCNYFPTFKN